MQYIADPNEVARMLGKSLGEPVYKTVGVDEDGNVIAIPVFIVKTKKERSVS